MKNNKFPLNKEDFTVPEEHEDSQVACLGGLVLNKVGNTYSTACG